MRLLKELLKNHETVWIYCEKDKQEHFLKKAEEEGFHTRQGEKPTTLEPNHLYALNQNMTLGYLSNIVWYLAHQTGDTTHLKIDYAQYITGEAVYQSHGSHIKSVEFREVKA